MSLHGMDEPQIKEAHAAAVAEPGGWFLIKYASRDKVELLSHGNGGIVEIRNHIAQFHDPSPLYGFLKYRRRNVIIKYLPEDCSRLIQARVAVHFNLVCDRFSPQDTILTIVTANELKDTKLSAACSLHTASGSTGSTSSSTSSLRRRRLMEIAEEVEEEEREPTHQLIGNDEERPKTSAGEPFTLDWELISSPDTSKLAMQADPPDCKGPGVVRPLSSKSFDEAKRPASSNKTISTGIYGYSFPYNKPKVKLGPRPTIGTGRRLLNAGLTAGSDLFRPTSSIPQGFKPFSKSLKKKTRDDTFSIKEEAEPGVSGDLSIPARATHDEPPRPHTSNGVHSVMSSAASVISTLSISSRSSKQVTMTPEKARLMKAMKLREKKKKQASPDMEAVAEKIPAQVTSVGCPARVSILEGNETEEVKTVLAKETQHGNRLLMSKPDSGIDVDVGADQGSMATYTVIHPASAIATSEETGGSTQVSSLFKMTDETVQAFSEQNEQEIGAEDAVDHNRGFEPGPDRPDREPETTQLQNKPVTEEAKGKEQQAVDGEKEEPRDGTVSEVHSILDEGTAEESNSTEPEVAETSSEDAVAKDISTRNIVSLEEGATEPGPRAEEGFAVEGNSTVEREEISSSPISTWQFSKFAAQSAAQYDMALVESEDAAKNGSSAATATSMSDADNACQTTEDEAIASNLSQLIMLSRFPTQDSSLNKVSPPRLTMLSTTSSFMALRTFEARQTQAEVENENARPVEENALYANNSEGDAKLATHESLGPIRSDLCPAEPTEKNKRQSVISLVDDDDLMEELQSATFQEALPVTVSKSPGRLSPGLQKATTIDPENAARSPSPRIVRTVSNPIRGPLLAPVSLTTNSARAVSTGAAFLHKITQQQNSDLMPKNSPKIGSTISQRIKALEQLSGGGVGGHGTAKECPSSTFFAVCNKGSLRDLSRSPSVVNRANLLTRSATSSPPTSKDSSPEMGRNRAGSMMNRVSTFEGGGSRSIQVTAQVVHEPGQGFFMASEPRADPADYKALHLKKSSLLVDVQAPESDSLIPGTFLWPSRVQVQVDEKTSEMTKEPPSLKRRLSKGRLQSGDGNKVREADEEKDVADKKDPRLRRRSSLGVVKDFIKDRRDSIRGSLLKKSSADKLSLAISTPAAADGCSKFSQSLVASTSSHSSSRLPSTPSNMPFSLRLNISSERSSLDQTGPNFHALSRSPSLVELESEGESGPRTRPTSPDSSLGGKSGNRGSRFMRRLSSSFGTVGGVGRKASLTTTISNTVAEDKDDEMAASGQLSSQPTVVAHMGDVNVQFPENLLWKRRTMLLDSKGFLVLSANGAHSSHDPGKTAAPIKRYHINEFRRPYPPDLELQDPPNSVCLDFVAGSGLRIACEDRMGQESVLQILRDAHQSHSNSEQ